MPSVLSGGCGTGAGGSGGSGIFGLRTRGLELHSKITTAKGKPNQEASAAAHGMLFALISLVMFFGIGRDDASLYFLFCADDCGAVGTVSTSEGRRPGQTTGGCAAILDHLDSGHAWPLLLLGCR